MNKKLFENWINELGHFKPQNALFVSHDAAYKDQVFVPKKTSAICVMCNEGNHLVYAKYLGYKEHPHWNVKCTTCGAKWQQKVLNFRNNSSKIIF